MIKIVRYIWMLVVVLTSAAIMAKAQIPLPEKVCVGTERRYWVEGMPGSTYTWKINGEFQSSIINQIDITWVTIGKYTLEVQEHQANCNGDVQSGLVEVADLVTPDFNPIEPVCIGSPAITLPITSLNGIRGTWTPEFNNTLTTEYTFTPTEGQCATSAKLTITIVQRVTPTFDLDADGDGILNKYEGGLLTDTDGDGLPNYLDIDADGDGIVDYYEAQPSDKTILPSNAEIKPLDSDGDGIPDFLDADSDNDRVPDFIEGNDANSDGKADRLRKGKDSDTDGLDDAYDTVVNDCNVFRNVVGSNAPLHDFDHDGLPDWRDDNDDNDKFPTKWEDLNGDKVFSNDDIDSDGYPEYLDYGRECDLLIPDAFSPNGDNIHDFYQIYCINHYPNAHIYIFDLLGNKIFEKQHYGNLDFWGSYEKAWWCGKPDRGQGAYDKNRLVTPGTYFYVLDLGNGEVKKSFVFVSY